MERGVGEMEPTPGAGGCLEEFIDVDREGYLAVYGAMAARGVDVAAVLLYDEGGLQVYAVVEFGEGCLKLREVRARRCGEGSAGLLKAAEWPEVSSAVIEGGCAEIVIPGDTRVRVERALRKLGVEGGFRVLAWAPLEPV
jgi:hypothetical protein